MSIATGEPHLADHYDYLIVGGGMVADSAAKAAHELDADANIGIIGADSDPPVARPALSKKLWTDSDFDFDQAWLRTAEQTGADVITGITVDSIDPANHQVSADGTTVAYRRLLLATGSTPKRMDLPSDDRIIFYRTADDYRRLRRLSGQQRRIAVVGGGYIGSELAAALVQNDTEVTMIFPDELLYGGMFPAELAQRLTKMYADHGVQLRSRSSVTGGAATDSGVSLTVDSGDPVDADAAVVGLGVEPNTGLAEQAGLPVDDGIIVDEYLTTSDPDVLAAGDVASYPDALFGRQRVEHVDNANVMGTQAGRNLSGARERYRHTPYFYSVMFGNRYEAVGTLDANADLVQDWTDDGERAVVYYLDDRGVVTGVLLWNVSDHTDDARQVIADSQAGTLTREHLRGRIDLRD